MSSDDEDSKVADDEEDEVEGGGSARARAEPLDSMAVLRVRGRPLESRREPEPELDRESRRGGEGDWGRRSRRFRVGERDLLRHRLFRKRRRAMVSSSEEV